MLVHQVVANVLFLSFAELPNELTHRIMGSCLHRPHDFVSYVSQTCQTKCFFTYLAAENKRHLTNCSTFFAFFVLALPLWHFSKLNVSNFNIIVASSVENIIVLEIEWQKHWPNMPTHKTGLDHPCCTQTTINDRPVHETSLLVTKRSWDIDVNNWWLFGVFFQIFWYRLKKILLLKISNIASFSSTRMLCEVFLCTLLISLTSKAVIFSL